MMRRRAQVRRREMIRNEVGKMGRERGRCEIGR
jgi:hypothetical protein